MGGPDTCVARGVSSCLAPTTSGLLQESVNEIHYVNSIDIVLPYAIYLLVLVYLAACSLVFYLHSGRSFNSLPIAAHDRSHNIPWHSAMTYVTYV